MSKLQQFEHRLEQVISGAFARAFRSAVQPVEIAAALQREVDNNTQIMSRDRRLVPNDFVVELSPGDLDRLAPYDSTMGAELAEQLKAHAQHQSYVFPGPITIAFEPAADLITGRFRIRSRAKAAVSGHGTSPAASARSRVSLTINGTVHPLTPPGVIIGRGSDTHIQINDPGVSRQHIEIRVAVDPHEGGAGAVSVHDLGSTNGMLVDGTKLVQAPLAHGSTVKIGNTTIVVSVSPEAG